MADTRTTTTPSYTSVTTEKSSGGGALWFIVGGIVVAVAVIAWLLSGNDFTVNSSAPAPAGDVSISVEDNAAPPAADIETTAPAAPADSAPADAAPAEPAPAN